MSVVVMGMDKPKRCLACDFQAFFNNGDIYCKRLMRPIRSVHTPPPDWCPLRPLPEKHGRLINADAFEAFVQEKWEQNEISNWDWMDFREWLRDQGTIIEAEGGSDE